MYTETSTGLSKKLIAWIHQQAYRQHWRVASWYEIEDLIQDGMLIAIKCRNKYNIDDKRFIGRVKFAFTNHITDLANKRITGKCLDPKRHGIKLTTPMETKLDDEEFAVLLGTLRSDSFQFFMLCYNEAPPQIKAVIALFTHQEALKQLRAPLKKGETRNSRMCDLLGISPEIDLCGQIRGYFSTA